MGFNSTRIGPGKAPDMPDRIIETEYDRKMLIRFIENQKPPFTVSVTSGKHRTTDQNRLQRLWVKEIADQLEGWTAEDVRGYCKLHFGVPILRAENEAFRMTYDRKIKPLGYADKLEFFREPLNLPVTRIMTTRQKTAYLDAVHKHFSEQGVILTDPSSLERGGAERSAA